MELAHDIQTGSLQYNIDADTSNVADAPKRSSGRAAVSRECQETRRNQTDAGEEGGGGGGGGGSISMD